MAKLHLEAIYRTGFAPVSHGLARLQGQVGNVLYVIHRRPAGEFRLTRREISAHDVIVDTRSDHPELAQALAGLERFGFMGLNMPASLGTWLRFEADEDALDIPFPLLHPT